MWLLELLQAKSLNECISIYDKFIESHELTLALEDFAPITQKIIDEAKLNQEELFELCVIAYSLQSLEEHKGNPPPKYTILYSQLVQKYACSLMEITQDKVIEARKAWLNDDEDDDEGDDNLYSKYLEELNEIQQKIETVVKARKLSDEYARILTMFKNSLQIGKSILEEEKQSIQKNEVDPAEKAKCEILQNAINSQKTMIDSIETLLTFNHIITTKEMSDTLSQFRTKQKLFENDLSKFPEESGFLARFKRWATDAIKDFIGIGTPSTKKTISNIISTTSTLFRVAGRKVEAVAKTDTTGFDDKIENDVDEVSGNIEKGKVEDGGDEDENGQLLDPPSIRKNSSQ